MVTADRVTAYTTQGLAEQLAVIPAHRRLFERLIGILVEEGVLKPEGDSWIVLEAAGVAIFRSAVGSGSIETTVSGMFSGGHSHGPVRRNGSMRCCVELVTHCSFFSPAATLILQMPCIAPRRLRAP